MMCKMEKLNAMKNKNKKETLNCALQETKCVLYGIQLGEMEDKSILKWL